MVGVASAVSHRQPSVRPRRRCAWPLTREIQTPVIQNTEPTLSVFDIIYDNLKSEFCVLCQYSDVCK